MATGFRDRSFDGIYNLGVMEHFSDDQIRKILREYHRILKDDGIIILFWPPRFGATVIVLKGIHFVLNTVLRRDVRLHPPEPSLIRSKRQAASYAASGGFRLAAYDFGIRDLFTYAVLVLEKA
jgi:SAM-dependent methyltransferase